MSVPTGHPRPALGAITELEPPASSQPEPDRTRGLSRAASRALLLAPAAVALSLWAFSLTRIDVRSLGEYGLPPALGAAWYAALAITVASALALLLHPRGNASLALLYVALVALILFGTVPALSAQPHYAWVYKHLGVVRYLEMTGRANPSIDIYNRWPGFFAFAAAISTLSGRANPVSYAAWADLFFMLLDVLLVTVAVRTLTRELRIAVGAALLFVLSNWVGQTYYSPQALAYTLSLALIVVMLRQLRLERGLDPPLAARVTQRLARRPQLPALALAPTWPRAASVSVVLGIDAVIVATHQLTPYVVLVSVALLLITETVRPRWLLLVMAAMTLGYLALNLRFIEHNYGLLSSIDPFNNVQGPRVASSPAPGKVFNTDVELLFILLVWVCTFAALIALFRRSLGVRALPLLALAVAPVAIVFGQNYGGEASLRIVLFSSPWCSALIAWAALTSRPRVSCVAFSTLAVCFAALFVVSYLGLEELNIVSPAEVQASERFYRRAPHGSVLVLAAPGFPYRYGGSYPSYRGPEGDANPNLMTEPAFVGRPLGAAQVSGVAGRIRVYSPHGYIAFTRDETAYAEVFRLTPPGAMDDLRAAVAASPLFRLWYANADVQIYELLDPPPVTVHREAPVLLQRSRSRSQRARRSRSRSHGAIHARGASRRLSTRPASGPLTP